MRIIETVARETLHTNYFGDNMNTNHDLIMTTTLNSGLVCTVYQNSIDMTLVNYQMLAMNGAVYGREEEVTLTHALGKITEQSLAEFEFLGE